MNTVLYSEKKIGKADNLDSRLKSLNGTLSPTEYVFTAAWKVKNGLEAEKKMHKIFGSRRKIGEWFVDDGEEIINMLDEMLTAFFEGERII